jgi:hypothetical protein
MRWDEPSAHREFYKDFTTHGLAAKILFSLRWIVGSAAT